MKTIYQVNFQDDEGTDPEYIAAADSYELAQLICQAIEDILPDQLTVIVETQVAESPEDIGQLIEEALGSMPGIDDVEDESETVTLEVTKYSQEQLDGALANLRRLSGG